MNAESPKQPTAPIAPPPVPVLPRPLPQDGVVPPPPPQVNGPAVPEVMGAPEELLATSLDSGIPTGAGAGDGDTRTPLPDGFVLEDYTIIRKLGQGGFGITYLARHTEEGTVVVIKEHMPQDLAVRDQGGSYVISATPEKESAFHLTMEEFMEEVTVLQGLLHPGIVPILSGFEANGTAYYVMPYVEGKTLDALGKPTLDKESRQREARSIRQKLAAMLDILEYMEQHQVVHRDVKPENILIDAEDQPILLDFGSARQLRPGKVFTNIFTAEFCAPEQALAKDDADMSAKIGPWTDIYALGATFHYLITRMLPPRSEMRGYAGMDPYNPLASRRDLCKLYGAAFLGSIDRALEMRPKNRWQSASAWRQTLVTGLLPASPQVLQRARFIMAGSALLVSILGGICLWAVRERDQAVQMYNLSLEFSEGILYDFNEELSDVPGATKLQAQLVTQLKNYLDKVDKLSLASDEKLQRALSSAWRNLGYIYIEQGNLEAATEALLRATGLQEDLVHEFPGNQTYRYNLARIWLYRAEVARRRNLAPTATQFVSQAAEVLRDLCEKTPGNPEYKCALGKAMEVTALLARSAGDAGLYKDSIQEQLKLYQGMSGTYSRNFAVQTGLGHAYLSAGQLAMDQGDYPTALKHFEEGKRIFSDLTAANPYRLSFKRGLATVYHSTGLLHSRMGEQDAKHRKSLDKEALADYGNQLELAQELASLDPDNAEYPFMQCRTMALMIDILLRTGQVNKAEAFCNTILEKTEALLATAPDNVDYAMLKAGALRGLALAHGSSDFSTGQAGVEFQESRDILERLLSQSPGNLNMRFLYMETLAGSAKLAADEGDTQQARRWLELAIVIMEKQAKENPQNKLLKIRMDALRKQLSELKGKSK